MSTANKWLLGFVIFFTLVLFVVAMMVLNQRSRWQASIDKLEEQQQQLEDRHDVLLRGGAGKPGVQQLRHEVAMYLTGRGRAWYDVVPQQVVADTGQVRVGELPTETGISENLIVYLFQQNTVADDGSQQPGAYLGRFQVKGIADGQVVLMPQPKLLPRQLEQLAASPGPWAMYDLMPKDRHDIFAGMSDEQIEAMLPAESYQQYVDHGKPHNADQHPPDRRDQEGNYERALRDYDGLFTEMNRLQVVQSDIVASAEADLASVQQSIEQSRVQEEFMHKTIASLTAELAETRRQLGAVVAHKTDIETRLAAVEADIVQTQAENQRLADAWIELQLEELARIEQASQTAASTPSSAETTP